MSNQTLTPGQFAIAKRTNKKESVQGEIFEGGKLGIYSVKFKESDLHQIMHIPTGCHVASFWSKKVAINCANEMLNKYDFDFIDLKIPESMRSVLWEIKQKYDSLDDDVEEEV